MKKWIICVLAILLFVGTAQAFIYDIEILSKEEIHKLSDEKLQDRYIDASIEKKASGEFHAAAGFSSKKDYDKRKELLRYLFDLRREISTRENLQIDSVDMFLE